MANLTKTDFFKVGGSLPGNLPSYIVRQADTDLYNYLQKGEFCYVLTARQMGKSSLKVRISQQLKKEGWVTPAIDLTSIGTSGFTTEQWYVSFLSLIVKKLMDLDDFDDWWDDHSKFTPVNRMSIFWEEILVKTTDKPIAIFIDEVDLLLSIDPSIFNINDFFAAIRAVYNKRSENPALNRINFTIIGVASPLDLMSVEGRTPFNIGESIQVLNFRHAEASPLLKGFCNDEQTNQIMLQRIIYWTGGQPFLTQQLSQKLAQKITNPEDAKTMVDQVVQENYFRKNILGDDHFFTIEDRIINNEMHNLWMLETLQTISKKDNTTLELEDKAFFYLKLSGLVTETENGLKISNRIYENVFDKAWLERSIDNLKRPITIFKKQWEENGQRNEDLLVGSNLKRIESWEKTTKLSSAEQKYLDKSRIYVSRKKFIRTAGWLGSLAILLALIGLYFFQQNKINASQKKQETILKNWEIFNTDYIRANNLIHQNDICPDFLLERMEKTAKDQPDTTETSKMLVKISELKIDCKELKQN
jgi:hypothetical protein